MAARLEVSGLRSPKLSSSPLQHNHGGSDACYGNITPDRVGDGRKTLIDVFDGLFEAVPSGSRLLAGVLTGVARGG